MDVIRIGAGAGFAEDRIEPAVELAEHGDLDYLVFECLAERTIGIAALDRLANPAAGYNEWLRERMTAVLPACVEHGTKIITNMGAANPIGAADEVVSLARELGLTGLRVAAVTGDDVLDRTRGSNRPFLDRSGSPAELGTSIVSANAYLGCVGVVRALAQGADVVITGRVADPSLFVGPLVHAFGWSLTDWDRLGKAICVGHLLECAGQITGGYYADPGVKDVPGLARLGFPFAEVDADGGFVITKVPGSGGVVNVATCTEQLLYEIHDPAAYVSADAIADFSQAELTQIGPDRVQVTGVTGRARPDELKVSVGYLDGYLGTGEISYAGPNALARGRLALDIVRERLAPTGDARFELIGVDAVRRGTGPANTLGHEPGEVRIRVAARADTLSSARRIGREVAALWLNGPAGGAGATRRAEQVLAIASILLPRDRISSHVRLRTS